MKEICIWWIRRDLRLKDNTALHHALESGYPVLALFVFDKAILDELPDRQDRRVMFIHQTLHTIHQKLSSAGSTLYIYHGLPLEAFEELTKTYIVKSVFANGDYEPYAYSRDKKVADFLTEKSIAFNLYKDQVIFHKGEVVKADGKPYTVFTPYSKAWKNKFRETTIESYPDHSNHKGFLQTEPFAFPSIEDLDFEKTDNNIPELQLSEKLIRNYHITRNDPVNTGTSHVGIHLRFGTLSIRELVTLAEKWNETWLNELIWREFFMMILFHFPNVVNNNFRRKYDALQWRNNEKEFELWCEGKTGYPIVDAGMRQLNETGFMHNRVRMITAGFLTKHLLIDWRWGEAYFAGKLLDYELASNNGNWQWAAGTGCDAAPYFRIFNPETQMKKFDPELIYVKRWVKDYEPGYLRPIVEHVEARKRALEVFGRLKD